MPEPYDGAGTAEPVRSLLRKGEPAGCLGAVAPLPAGHLAVALLDSGGPTLTDWVDLSSTTRARANAAEALMDDDLDQETSEEDRSAQVRGALLKALAVVAVIGVVVAIGTTVVVHALGLNDSESPGPVGAGPAEPNKPLPTKALKVPGEDKDTESAEPSQSASPDAGKKGKIGLEISPVKAKAMERVNLTGTYKGADNVALQVQRFEEGKWSDFGVDATVRVGTYATYVQTGRSGEQRFRMYDPQAREGSNVVLVTIG
jgi:hypothetical protein